MRDRANGPAALVRHCKSLLAIAMTLPMIMPLPTVAAPDGAQTWDQLQKAGSEAFFVMRYGDAERLLNQAVIKGAAFGESDLRFAKSLGELGRLYTVRGRFSEAEPLLEEELHVKQMAMGKDNTDLIPAMGSLIQFYLTHGTAEKADPVTEEILALIEGKLKEYNSQAAGGVKFQKGQPLTGWAGTAALSMRDPLIEWAITCDAIADDYHLRTNYEMAERLYKAALNVKTTVLGNDHLSLANSYDSLGALCLDKNDDLNAEFYFKDSLDITEHIQPPEHPQVYARLDKLAKCYIKEKKYPEAEKLYMRAQNLWKGNASKAGLEARAKYALGNLYCEEKNYEAAAPLLQQALQLAEEYNGADSIVLVPYLQRYAYALYYLGQRDETDQLKARASTIAGTGTTL